MLPLRLARLTAVVGLAVAGLLAYADAPERSHQIEPEDYFTINVISQCAASPDGQYVAFSEVRWGEPDQRRTSEIWVVRTADQQPQRLTFEPVNDSNPQWGADSAYIYFLTKRDRGDDTPPYDGTQQVWRTGLTPGEPFPVTRVKDGVSDYQLSPDGRTLYYVKEGRKAKGEWADLREKYPKIKFGDGEFHYTELWKLDLQSWREEKLVDEDRVITEFTVTPDGRRIAMITTPDDRLITMEGQSRIDVYDVETRDIQTMPEELYREQAPSPYGWLEGPAWSDDGKYLAWTVSFDGYPTEIIVAHPESRRAWKMTRPDEIGVTGHLHWRPDSHDLCFTAEDHARQRVYCLHNVERGGQGDMTVLTPGDVVVHGFSFSHDGQHLALIRSDTKSGLDLFLGPSTGGEQWTRLTDQNPQIHTWKLPQISLVQWTSTDGTPVEGILELPPDYQEGDGPLPLVVEIHGGPTAATLYQMRFWIYGRTLMAAKGYALLSPNYRGSTGYGDKFLTDLIGHEADRDVADIMTGVEALIARGIADPERMAVMGWSNGGFLTNAIIVRTQQFKAASTGAGVVDQFLQWGLEDTPGHVINYMQGLPWQQREAYLAASAIYQLGNVTTPTLIHVGADDPRVPAAHCRALYRGLKEYVGVPTALLVYPGEGHGLTVRKHRLAKMEWDLAWFDKYVLNKGGETAAK